MLIPINLLSAQSPELYPVAFDKGLSIKGQINELNVPIPCRIRLYHKKSGRVVNDIASDNAGNYVFEKLVRVEYFLVVHHPSSQYNALIADNVVPK